MFFKFSGLLDLPQSTLPADVWDPSRQLKPEIREQILTLLSSVVDLAQVDRVFIIGSITGYKYTSTSDIDINVVLNQTTTKNESTNAHLNARQINGVPAIGGKHPINFFIKSYSKSRDWDTYLFGVYDVLNNFWKKEPPLTSDRVRNPQDQFPLEIMLANMFSRRFANLVSEMHSDSLDLEALKGTGVESKILAKQNEIEQDVRALLDEESRIHKEREWIYNRGWGIPRRSQRNIVYKLIEHGQYGNVLEALKSLRRVEPIQKKAS